MEYTLYVDNENMEVDSNFFVQLEQALSQKQDWFNSDRLQQMLEQYRLLYTCVKNINELLIKKSLVTPDPYKLDRRISDIVVPESTPFLETDIPAVLGARLSEYETMLDFICTYFRFSVENITIGKIKSLIELNKVFDWSNLSPNSGKSNTRALAMVLNQARVNSPAVVISTLTDSTEKCAQTVIEIDKCLSELATFQRELYKGRLRKDLFEHPEFDKVKAFSSPEDEFNEIKRLYGKVLGKRPFFNDLISEIIKEDQDPNRDAIREKLLNSLSIKQKEVKKEKTGPSPKELLIQSIISLSGFAPVLSQIESKLTEDFNLLFVEKKGFFAKLKAAFRKAFGLKEKERICSVPVADPKTGAKTLRKINVNEFMLDLGKKRKIYASFVPGSAELQKIESASEDSVLSFLNHQISENQTIFSSVNALDDYFKANVDVLLKPKLKGLKIDLSSYRNIIIAVNKRRGEYVSLKEEIEQMKKLGISK